MLIGQLELPAEQRHWAGPEWLLTPKTESVCGILLMPTHPSVQEQARMFWEVLLTQPDTTLVAYVRPFSLQPPSYKPLI